ncbi:TonB-dependent receptor [Sulfurospirillum sp.]|uniref:TonB-dependent receptor n=1 Tax=Sulfurospirillum sp. TaxID=2053622 RepID=UPI002FDCE6B5
MKRAIGLSLVVSTMLFAETGVLEPVTVVGETFSKEVKDINGEELKSADLADALSRNSSSITVIRSSGIANDILLRGQKRDNINILMDEAKIYGGCPNRMDPAITHINADNIENVKIIEGPYDVEHFGTLSGLVVAETKNPTKEPSGEVNLGMGSYGYKKASASASGGNDVVRVLFSASTEESDQYKDGNGDTFYDQIAHAIAQGKAASTNQYRNSDQKAYEKKTFMGKVFINPVENQEIRLGYTLNRSDNVLYPSRSMDADYDDSDIYTFGYSLYDLGAFSKELSLEAYKSTVDHPMSGRLRVIPTAGMMAGKYMTAKMDTNIEGATLKNKMNFAGGEFVYGIDVSRRNWDGESYTTTVATGANTAPTPSLNIPDVDTTNKAIFAKYMTSVGDFNIQAGTRYDDTSIKANRTGLATIKRYDNDYEALSANTIVTYKANDNVDYFIGFGKASRVPDARELYHPTNSTAILDQVTNYEADMGFKTHYDGFGVKGKLFYSILKDYIYYNADALKYVNVDATIYGAELDAYYDISDTLTLGYGMSYLKGKKDEPLAGQSDKDLADIVPLRAMTSLTYHVGDHALKTEMIAAKRWNNVDMDNGEQELAGYAVFNLKYNYKVTKHFDVTLGVDNIFDKTYAVSNTYKDVTLLNNAAVDDAVMLINEPGRYLYANLRYRF